MSGTGFMSMMDPYVVAATGGGGLMGDLLNSPDLRRQRAFDAMGNLGAALIQASAPSTVPRDAASVIGQGLGAAAQGAQNGEDRYLKRALVASQVATAAQKMKQLQAWQDLLGGVGGSSAAPPAADPTNPGTAPAAIGDDYYKAVAQGESGGSYTIPNAQGSGAFGKYQFMPSTWATVAQSNPNLNLPPDMTKATPEQQEAAMRALTASNAQGLQTAGIPPTPQNLYLAHRFGVDGAKTVLGAAPASPVSSLFPQGWSQQNPDMQGVTAGQFIQNAGQRFAGGATPAQYQPQQPKTLAEVVKTIPPAVRQMIGVMGPEKGLPLMMKYADPDTTPAIDTRTGQVVFAPKTALNSGQYAPVDSARLGLERQREAREGANANVAIGPNGQPVVNETAVAAKKAISAAQGTDPEGEMLKGDYTDARKANTELQSGALIARTGMAQTNRLNSLLDQVKTGRFTSSTQEIKQMAKGLGINLEAMGVKDDTAPAQAAQALTGQMALALRNPSQGAGMPGAMSDADRQFLTRMVPGLETTPEGRKLMIEYSQKMYQRQIDMAKIANDFMRSPEAKKDPNKLYQVLQDYADKNPLFSEKDLPANGMTPAPAGALPGNIPAPPAGFKLVPR